MNQENKDKKNLLRNGAWWSAADAFTTPFIIPFALALNATTVIVGLINSLQNLAIVASQVPGSEIVWIFKRRRAINNACEFFCKASWLAIVLIPFLPSGSWLTVLIAAVAIASFFSNLSYPAWTSFIADVIPKETRARYLANRNMWMGFVSIIITIFVGFYLDIFPSGDLRGFSSIFLFGFVAGIIAIVYFSRIKGKEDWLPAHRFRDYLKMGVNLRRFLMFAAYFNFTYMIASPFFAVYMLENLKMDYGSYVMFSAIAAFAGLVSQKHWGALIDKYGCKPMISIAVVGAAFVPFFFIFVNPGNLIYLVAVQILSGVAWAGIGLATFNMFLDTSDSNKRVMQTADYNLITTVPMIAAPILGGYVAESYTFILSGLPLIFLISAILRLSSLPLLGRIKEKHVEQDYASAYAFRVFVSIHPVKGLAHEIRVIDKEIKRFAKKL